MKTKKLLKRYLIALIVIFFSLTATAQIPNPAMVGYWENWQGNRFVKLSGIDDRYNVIQVSFAEKKNGRDYQLQFIPAYDETEFRADMAALQAQGKKVLISIGGQNAVVMLDSTEERDIFIQSVNEMVDEWGFDGIDIDLEGHSLGFTDIHVQTPGDPKLVYLIEAIDGILKNHYEKHGTHLLLTMAPETLYVQGGLASTAGSTRAAYLPIIEELRDSIDMLNVQLYNSGNQVGLDGKIYNQGNADWILAMTEAVIQGFATAGDIGTYSGLPAHKVGVALPGCHSYDAVPHKEMEAAMRYLIGEGPQPAYYELVQEGGYPDVRGMMTWSINSDRKCNPGYGFVDTYSKVFTDSPYVEISTAADIYEGEEDEKIIEVELFNDVYAATLDTANWTFDNLPNGVMVDTVIRVNDTIANAVLSGNASSAYDFTILNFKVTAETSEFANSSKALSRNRGVVFKPARTSIPGVVQPETFISYDGASVGSAANNGYCATIGEGNNVDIEINVKQAGDYAVNYYLRGGNRTHKLIVKLDGGINAIHNITSSTGWQTWEEHTSFKSKLTEGDHILTFHVTEGWLQIDSVEFWNTVSTNNVEVFNQPFFYPNPAQNQLFFDQSMEGTVSIFGVRGELVKQTQIAGTNQLNISELKSGVYMVKMETSNGLIYHNKLIKK